ncbi:hypothetical protein JCM19241_649 [Vibrio ishigakensis]|uniref:Uncharacterized protein n=1 Tax=Vibrio ishigakensis TaxID=1481914 RepID=A0A0B8QHA7_9VIBR|nr:hypothetical protein JCM19241_649 [Vibrio ishigakensis]
MSQEERDRIVERVFIPMIEMSTKNTLIVLTTFITTAFGL